MTPRVGRALREAVHALDAIEVSYAIVGGLAVGAWGVPRATRDVDLYASLPQNVRTRLKRELERRGFEVPAMEEELERFGVFRSKLKRERVFVDIFDAVGPLGESILSRRKCLRIGADELWFASPEDMAVLKAFSDRPRDHEDLVALVALRAPKMDLAYVETWAHTLDSSIGGDDVSERLRRAKDVASRMK